NYDPVASQEALQKRSETGNEGAVMTLAKCERVMEEVVRREVKKGTPGPGSYEIKAPIEENLRRPRMRIRFGGSTPSHLSTINREQLKTPGPGAYYPEYALPLKPQPTKPQPFNSTTERFDDQSEWKSAEIPAPGSYDVDEVDSLLTRIQKKASLGVGLRSKAFGSISDRFPRPKSNPDPGPGAYDTSLPTVHTPITSSTELDSTSRSAAPPSRIQRMVRRGPTKLRVGDREIG
ncbi:hypothetical protein HK097_006608, partial [Rhizophlyctis rosea]